VLVFGAFGPLVCSPSLGVNQDQTPAESLYCSAKAALQQGDLDGAEKYFQQSLSISQHLVPDSPAVARSLNGLGDVAQQRGRPPEAEAYYQQALAITQKIEPSGPDTADSLDGLARVADDRGDLAKFDEYALRAFSIRQKLDSDSLDLAWSLNNTAGVYLHHKDWDKAEESYKKALSIQERLAPDSLVLAETLKNLGRFFFNRQKYDEAVAYHRQALTIRQKLAPGGLPVADSLKWLGLCAHARQDVEEAERYYRAALTIQEKLAPGSVHVALTLNQLRAIAEYRGDWVAAEKDDREAIAIWEKLAPNGVRVKSMMMDLANVLVWRGDLAEAEQFARRALAENRKIEPAGRDVAWGLFTLGNIAIDRGDYVAADDYYHQALAISQKVDPGGSMPARMMRGLGMIAEYRGDLGQAEDYYRLYSDFWEKIEPNGNNFAQGLFSVGYIAHERGDLAQAERCYQRALAIWEKTTPDTLFVAQALGKLGRLARDRGELARAEEYQRRAIAIEQKQSPIGPDLAEGLNDLGDVLLARKDLSQAEESYRQALAIRETILPGTSSHAESLASLAALMRRKGEPEAAAQYYAQALDALENQTARLGGGDELRASFRARHAAYYKDYIDLLIEQKHPELAFQVVERFRARTLLETLAMAHADVRKGADPELLSRERTLQESLTAKTQRKIQLLGAKNHESEIAALDKDIQNLHAQFQEVKDRIRASSPTYAALTQPQPISAKQVQEQLLDENTVLLEYSLGEERSYVWAVGRDSLNVYELPKRAEIESAARDVYHLFSARDAALDRGPAVARQVRLKNGPHKSAALSRMVLEPVAGQIATAKRLLIVSDGALQYIPLAALPVRGGTQTHLLLQDHEIINLPSASVLALLQRQINGRQKPSREVAVLADPVFAKDDARLTLSPTHLPLRSKDSDVSQGSASRSAEQLERAVSDLDSATRGPFLRRLPFSRREARAIIASVPAEKSMQALDFQASRAMAISAELSQYRIVHFATHGLLDSEHPELSGLVFSLVNAHGEPENGFLGLEDVYNLNLAADLVVLSACDTGLGKEISGEGLVGLTQGFMYAGAPQVVASLWNVDDAATAELMAAFYRAMEKQGKPPAAALRQAQTEIRRQERWKNPYYWAGFVIQGQGSPR
jgi:CHAT domain-containing protein/tetratricopeptide (TPR) repeat protein